ncbi:MAG: ABC transporter permease, partial [Clostridia bacterium]|nr:ABC transporter permease [Clostridia bacterium]
SCSMFCFGYLMAKIIPSRMLGVQVASLVVSPTSILGGYTFPLMAMPEIYKPIGNWIPFTHYGKVIRELCLKEIGFSAVKNDFNYILIFWLIELLLFALFSLGAKIYETAKLQTN